MEAPVIFGNYHLARNDSMYNEHTLFVAKLGNTPSSVSSNPKPSDNLLKIFPNPASTNASLNFILNKPGNVSLAIFDLLGRRMKEISLGELSAGEHSQQIDLRGLANGTYIYKMQIGGDITSAMFTIMK